MKVLIIGAGIGGLACAIACQQEGFEVVILERADRIVPIGAGIQIPPNGARVARQLGYMNKLLKCGVVLDAIEFRRYANGKTLHTFLSKDSQSRYGELWMVIHRADFHAVLWQKCEELGVSLCLNKGVERIDFNNNVVHLEDGGDIQGDVIVGADGKNRSNLLLKHVIEELRLTPIGLHSVCRNQLLGSPSPAVETGDLAYRAVFPAEYLKALEDPRVDELCARKQVTAWFGPDRHTVFYPVKGGREFNLVLVRPDNMQPNEKRIEGDIEEMRESYAGWDKTRQPSLRHNEKCPIMIVTQRLTLFRLTKLISLIPKVLKWKLCTHPELTTWTKGSFALLGDSCHPSLPYQAQGAAMAVEDGAVLGKLLGLLKGSAGDNIKQKIPEILELYESLRKSRTTVNVAGALSNRKWYHVEDGPEQEARDAELGGVPLKEGLSPTGWRWVDKNYQMDLLGRDSVAEAVEAFKQWDHKQA
ncbi:FAD-dependent monooxygenase OpS4 [Colletotrichum spaethianum]|uniref:FAD-dependent monooxygenase OpS4 n=1 Tax=Colletotrichum spaethianum TaxID=700344 RepID=A0AA37L575_9PEZI|nr:FAD-dependent monooxygenase OpS4 [Colletotrichum spaethianum]GKT42062.1 FAD-dependent monooxygenase OpS4 [Colletotrichum spaethianum]